MLTVGVDIISISRIASATNRWGDRFLKRIYTSHELSFCGGRADRLASRFAAKEAVMKALGTGIRGVGWKEVEVVRKLGHAPSIQLHGRADNLARAVGVTQLALSLAHSHDYAVASVVGDRQ